MGRKGLVTSIFSKLVDTSTSSSSPVRGGGHQPSWPWPSCADDPQTASFRAGYDEPCCTSTSRSAMAARDAGPAAPPRLELRGAAAAGEMYKTVNSVYFDSAADDYFSLVAGVEEEEDIMEEEVVDDGESCFSTTTASEEWSEAVIRSLGRSTSTHRFFFDPGPPSINSIAPATTTSPPSSLTTVPPAESPPRKEHPDPEPETDLDDVIDDGEKEQRQEQNPSKNSSLAEGSVAVAVDSSDPFSDFRASMEEMVAAHGLRDWAQLGELLTWYLRVNAKRNHPLIVGAFVDMLIGLASSPPSTTTTTATTSNTTTGTGKSTKSSTTTTGTATTSTAIMKRCRGAGAGHNEACCSSSSSSCAAPDDSNDAAEEKASSDDPDTRDDDRILRHDECEHQCRST